MDKQELCENFINEKITINEVLNILKKMSKEELNDLILYVFGDYGGSFANEFILQFRELLVYEKDFLQITKEIISKSCHPLLHQSLFEFFFFHVGIQEPQFYYDYKINVSHLKPYEEFIPKNLSWIGFESKYNESLYSKIGITKDELVKLKKSLVF